MIMIVDDYVCMNMLLPVFVVSCLMGLPIEGKFLFQPQPLRPKSLKINAEHAVVGHDDDMTGVDCCDSCEPCPRKDVKTSSIAIKAAQEAKEAQEAQQMAGAQAARQVKAQLAERAYQAARAAEAAQAGKQAMVDQLEHEVREAQAVVQEEVASCQQTQANLQIALTAATQAGHLLKALTTSLQIAQSNLINSQQAAEGAQQELAEKAALVDAAKCRVEALLRELCVARQDLYAIRQAAYKAQCAARNAECNAQRNRRRLQQKAAAAAAAAAAAPKILVPTPVANRRRRTNNVVRQADKKEKNR